VTHDPSAAEGAGPAADKLTPEPHDAVPPHAAPAEVVPADAVPADAVPAPAAPLAEAPADPPSAEVPAERFSLEGYEPAAGQVQFSTRRRTRVGPSRRRRRRQRIRSKVLGVGMLFVGLFVLGLCWVAFRTYQAYSQLEAAASLVDKVQDQVRDISDIDQDALAVTLSSLQEAAAAARSAVDDPLYSAATTLPWLGPNLAAIDDIAGSVDDLASRVVPQLVTVTKGLQPEALTSAGGGLNLLPVIEAGPGLQAADDQLAAVITRIQGIPRGNLLTPIANAVTALDRKLVKAQDLIGSGAKTAGLMSAMLGGDGDRQYLLVFQNLAEQRATGGIFGSYALVSVKNGTISIAAQDSVSRTLGPFDPPITQLSPTMEALYSNRMATFPTSVNFTPDFPTAASLFAQMYEKDSGTRVDGVLALDPVVLGYLLKATDPLPVGEGLVLSPKTAAKVLLSDVYDKFKNSEDQQARDLFLALATKSAFDALVRTDAPDVLLAGLERGMNERRVLLWSAHDQEQAQISETALAGLITPVDAPEPSLGVFLNDGTGAKLGYYLSGGVTVTAGECRPNGLRDLTLKISLSYDAPAKGLPPYVLGGSGQAEPYTLLTNVFVLAPQQGQVISAQMSGKPVPLVAGFDHGRAMGKLTIRLEPGRTAKFTVVVSTGVATTGGVMLTPSLALTPLVTPWFQSVTPYPACEPR